MANVTKMAFGGEDKAPDLNPDRQHTLKTGISCSGTGLHCGQKINMTLSPGETDSGIVFRRVDIAGQGAEITADWRSVVDTRLCTTIGNGAGITVATIEHLMAALAGYGIDNAVIEINGPEVPIMDGSSAAFAFLIECAGIEEQHARRRTVEILKPVSVADEDRSAVLLPGRGSSLSVEIDFENPVIARQCFTYENTPESFRRHLARARTFGLESEVAQLRAMGLARGGSLDNAVVVGDERVLNDEGLRFEDEFVRHKALDTLGDLFLAGGPIKGHFHGFRTGHELNYRLLRTLFASRDAWRWTASDEESARQQVAARTSDIAVNA